MKKIIFECFYIAIFATVIGLLATPPLLFPFADLACIGFGYLLVGLMVDSKSPSLVVASKLMILLFFAYLYSFHLVFFVNYIHSFAGQIAFVIFSVMPYWLAGCAGFLVSRRCRSIWGKIVVSALVFWSLSVCLVQAFTPYVIPAYFSSSTYFSDIWPDSFFVILQNPEVVFLFFTLVSAVLFGLSRRCQNWMPFAVVVAVVLASGLWQFYLRIVPILQAGTGIVVVNINGQSNSGNYISYVNDIKVMSVEPQAIFEEQGRSLQKQIEDELAKFARDYRNDKKLVVFSESSSLFNYSIKNGDAASNFEWVGSMAKDLKLDIMIHVRGASEPNSPLKMQEGKSYYVLVRPDGGYAVSEKKWPMIFSEQMIVREEGGSWMGWKKDGMQNGVPSEPLTTSFGLKVIPEVCFDGIFAKSIDTELNQSGNLIVVAASLVNFYLTENSYRFEMANHVALGLAAARSMGLPYVYTVSDGGGFAYSPNRSQSISETYLNPNKKGFVVWSMPYAKVSPYHKLKSQDMGLIGGFVFLMILFGRFFIKQCRCYLGRVQVLANNES